MQFNSCLVIRFLDDYLFKQVIYRVLCQSGACLLLLFALFFTGCSQVPVSPSDSANIEAFSRFHRQQAQQLINSGSYYQALIHVEILAMVDGSGGRYEKNIADLWNRIRSKKQKLLEQSKEAEVEGNDQKAYQILLTALSLDPEDTSLLPLLRKHYSAELRDGQQKKKTIFTATRDSEKLQGKRIELAKPAIEKNVASVQSSPITGFQELYLQGKYLELIDEIESSGLIKKKPELVELFVKSHLALAKQQRDAGNFEKAAFYAVSAFNYQISSSDLQSELVQFRKDVAMELLEEGKSLLRTDLERAVQILEQAKELDNQDGSIQLALERAYRLKDNLSRIKGVSP